MQAPVKRSVTLAGHRTSISLESDFWDAVREIASAQNRSINALLSEIDRQRNPATEDAPGLSSAIRCYVLDYYRARLR